MQPDQLPIDRAPHVYNRPCVAPNMLKDGFTRSGAPEGVIIIEVNCALNDVGALWQINYLSVWAVVKRLLDGGCCVCQPIAVDNAVDGGADGPPFRDPTGDAGMSPIYSPVLGDDFFTCTRSIHTPAQCH